MLRANILIFLVLFCVSASANDFRGLNFGDSCKHIYEYELNVGSEHVEENNGSYQFFKNSYLGRTATIGYICKNNKFIGGGYDYTLASLKSANQFFATVLTQFEAMYGQPINKTINSGYGSSAFWKKRQAYIYIGVMNKDDIMASVGIVIKRIDE